MYILSLPGKQNYFIDAIKIYFYIRLTIDDLSDMLKAQTLYDCSFTS